MRGLSLPPQARRHRTRADINAPPNQRHARMAIGRPSDEKTADEDLCFLPPDTDADKAGRGTERDQLSVCKRRRAVTIAAKASPPVRRADSTRGATMPISTSCQTCQTSYRLPDAQQGKRVRCRHCGDTF